MTQWKTSGAPVTYLQGPPEMKFVSLPAGRKEGGVRGPDRFLLTSRSDGAHGRLLKNTTWAGRHMLKNLGGRKKQPRKPSRSFAQPGRCCCGLAAFQELVFASAARQRQRLFIKKPPVSTRRSLNTAKLSHLLITAL